MDSFRKIAKEEDIPLGSMKSFEIEHHRFLVAHTESGFYAIENECSHDLGVISTGQLYKDQIICSRHGAKFDLKTGAVKAPPAVVPIETIELKIIDNEIYVRLLD